MLKGIFTIELTSSVPSCIRTLKLALHNGQRGSELDLLHCRIHSKLHCQACFTCLPACLGKSHNRHKGIGVTRSNARKLEFWWRSAGDLTYRLGMMYWACLARL